MDDGLIAYSLTRRSWMGPAVYTSAKPATMSAQTADAALTPPATLAASSVAAGRERPALATRAVTGPDPATPSPGRLRTLLGPWVHAPLESAPSSRPCLAGCSAPATAPTLSTRKVRTRPHSNIASGAQSWVISSMRSCGRLGGPRKPSKVLNARCRGVRSLTGIPRKPGQIDISRNPCFTKIWQSK